MLSDFGQKEEDEHHKKRTCTGIELLDYGFMLKIFVFPSRERPFFIPFSKSKQCSDLGRVMTGCVSERCAGYCSD